MIRVEYVVGQVIVLYSPDWTNTGFSFIQCTSNCKSVSSPYSYRARTSASKMLKSEFVYSCLLYVLNIIIIRYKKVLMEGVFITVAILNGDVLKRVLYRY